MIMARDWLWDRKISLAKARAILKNPHDKRFIFFSALLLARKNTPKEVFKAYLKADDFVRYWQQIKRQMRKNQWNNPRVEFWQAIYEKIRDKYKKRGIVIINKPEIAAPKHDFCIAVADKIRLLRKQKGITQSDLARKLKVSQQLISRIEQGRENISLLTLKKTVDKLGGNLRIDIE